MQMRVGNGHHKLVRCLGFFAGWALAAIAWAVPIAESPTSPTPGFQSIAEAPTSDVGALSAVATDAPAKAAPGKSAETPARAEQPAPRSEPAATPIAANSGASVAEPESIRASLKDLATSTGAVDALHSLNSEVNSATSGAFADGSRDGGADGVRHADAQAGSEVRIATRAAPLTAEQRKLDEAQASFLFSALLEEVLPWLIAAAVMYVVVYGARLLLAYNRMKAERKRKRRQSRSGSRTRSARVE